MPKRIQRKRTKGWRMPENTVYVGRPSRFGNPFYVGGYFRRDYGKSDGGLFQPVYTTCGKEHANTSFTLIQTVEEALEWYRWYLNICDWKHVQSLRGKDLACWCKEGEPCHADLLLEFANN